MWNVTNEQAQIMLSFVYLCNILLDSVALRIKFVLYEFMFDVELRKWLQKISRYKCVTQEIIIDSKL